MKRSVAANVKRLRADLGITQEELGGRAMVQARYVQEVERGKANMTLETLVRVATALDVEARDLLEPAKLTPPRKGRPPKRLNQEPE